MGPLADSESHPVVSDSSHPSSHPSSSFGFSPATNTRLLFGGLITQAERVITVTTRMKNTMTCIAIYVVLMILNIFVMAWEISGRGYNSVILTLECLINLFIIAEVTIGVYGLGRDYFRNWMNLVDFTLAAGCVAFFCFLLVTPADAADYMSEVDAVLLTARFLFQVLRLSVLIYRSRNVALMQAQEEVDFNAISLEACIDEEASRRARIGLDSPAAGVTTNGEEKHQQQTPTSYIYLKPSIYLELQNARAFAEPTSIAASSSSSSTLDGAIVSSPTKLSVIHERQPSDRLGSPNVPILTPPITPEPFDGSATTSSGDSSVTSTHSASHTPNGFTRSFLHPRLAHDSDDVDEDDLHDEMEVHFNAALEAERASESSHHQLHQQELEDHHLEERRGLI